MNSDKIEEIVKWRMGTAYDVPIIDWRDTRLNFDTAAFLDRDLVGAVRVDHAGVVLSTPPGRDGYNPSNRRRIVSTSEDLGNAWRGQSKPLHVIIAMQDARLFPCMEYIGESTDARCVQLSYARTVDPVWRKSTEMALWPWDYVFRNWKLPTSTPAPWEVRKAKLFWRGQTSGMSYILAEEARPILTGIRQARRWLKDFLAIEVVQNEQLFESLHTSYQRLLAVKLCKDIEGADVRFIPMYDGDISAVEVAERFLGGKLLAERLPETGFLAAQQEYKYILSLPGSDVASSLRTDLLSGCVTLMPRPFWENIWFFGLEPFVHYIPLRADFADLEERLQWCQDNDAQCREIAAAARSFACEHFEPSLEFKVQSRMIERMVNQLTMVGGAWPAERQ